MEQLMKELIERIEGSVTADLQSAVNEHQGLRPVNITGVIAPVSRSSSPKGFRYWFNDEENAEINLRTSYLCVQRVHPASCFSNLFTK